MASFRISQEEYKKLMQELTLGNSSRSIKIVLCLIVSVAVIIMSWIYGQYLFAITVFAFAILLSWLLFLSRSGKAGTRYLLDQLIVEEYEAVLEGDYITLTLGRNVVVMDVTAMKAITKLSSSYHFQHRTGVGFFVPFASMTQEEKELAEGYRKAIHED